MMRVYTLCYENYDVENELINDVIVPVAVYSQEASAQNALNKLIEESV